MFFKIDVLENFAKFTEKHLYWSLFLIKLQASGPVTSSKKETPTECFPVKFAKFSYRAFPVVAFACGLHAPLIFLTTLRILNLVK